MSSNREAAHKLSVLWDMGCMRTAAGKDVHGTRCDMMMAAIDTREAEIWAAAADASAVGGAPPGVTRAFDKRAKAARNKE